MTPMTPFGQVRQRKSCVRAAGQNAGRTRRKNQGQLDKAVARTVHQTHGKPRRKSPALANDWRAGSLAIDR